MSYDKTKTDPRLRRMPKGSPRAPTINLSPAAWRAMQFLVRDMETRPDDELPANASGAISLALVHLATARGMPKEVPADPERVHVEKDTAANPPRVQHPNKPDAKALTAAMKKTAANLKAVRNVNTKKRNVTRKYRT